MKRLLVWICFLGKRQLKRPAFVLLLLALPAACGLLFAAQRPEENTLAVALYCEAPDSMTVAALDSLCEEDGIFRFYRCESEEQVLREVASRKAECGYVFPEGLESKMKEGKATRSIGAYSSPSSVASYLTHEVVYAKLFAEYAEHAFVEYIGGNPLFAEIDRAKLSRDALAFYRESRERDRAFSFEFERMKADGTKAQNESAESAAVTPVRGFLAVFVLLGGLMGAVDSWKDERKQAYLAASPGFRTWIPLLAIAVPAALTAVSAGISLAVAGLSTGILREVSLLLAYTGMVTAFCSVLADLLRRETLLYACIPVLIMGSLLFSPVLLRLGSFLPVFRVLEKLFLPTAYLNAANGNNPAGLFIGTASLLAAGAILRWLRQKNG